MLVHRAPHALASAALPLLVLACQGASSVSGSAGGVDFASAPLVTAPSASQSLMLAAWTAPEQPPTSGVIAVRLFVGDATTDAGVDGLVLNVVPEMPAMGHGTSMQPTVSALGSGMYLATNVDLFMPGEWDLDITITGAVSDQATVPIDVQ